MQVGVAEAEFIKAGGGGRELLARTLEDRVFDKAPWFKGRVKEVHWMSCSRFQRRLAARFAQGRCRLIGDAAHQTGPIGVQSMNLGLLEAFEVADDVIEMTTGEDPSDSGFSWNVRARQRWLGLLGADGCALHAHFADDWLDQRAGRLIPCLPASLEELSSFLGQLGPIGGPGLAPNPP
jgi:2-polyprenyl-6-methoxyphenol hydroxylase-like FAD-dependent oxidoreductase